MNCPKCRSADVSAQKKGFSTGKAAAGVVLTGGVGALAGLHGSNDVVMHCLKCGHVWNPVQQAKQESQARQQAADSYTDAWKKALYAAYESGDKVEAEAIARRERGALLDKIGLEGVYDDLRSSDRLGLRINVILFSVFIALVVWVISCVTG